MDIGTTLSRAFNIVLKHRALWLLGFLASLASSTGSTFNFNPPSGSFSPAGPGDSLSPELERFFDQLSQNAGLIFAGLAGFLCVALVISIVLWLVSIIASGGLVGGVQQIEETGTTTFGSAWSVGISKFWPLLGLNVLLALPGIVLLVLFLVLLGGSLIPFLAGAATGDERAAVGFAGGVLLLMCGGGVLACIGLIYLLLASALYVFGERAIVIENLGVFDALRKGWEVFRNNLGNIILIALLMFVISIVIGFVTAIVAGLLFAPVLVSILLGVSNEGSVGIATIILGALTFIVVIIISAIIAALFTAFYSTTWTLAYRQFTGRGLSPVATTPAPLPTA